MPYKNFLDIASQVRESEPFSWWLSRDATGREPLPIKLLLLGALRYIGQGWTFDNIEEATAMHEETHCQFFHILIHWGSTTLCDKYVVSPQTSAESKTHMHELGIAGLTGAVGSSDATHVGMERCSYRLMNLHSGPKLKMRSRTYNITVNYHQRILSIMRGHPARWNDKTIVLFDAFV
jgi:hypothetical protein